MNEQTKEETKYNFLSVADTDIIDLISNIMCNAKEEDFAHLIDGVTMRIGLSSGTCLKIISNLLEWMTYPGSKDLEERWYYTDFTKEMLILKESIDKKLVIIQEKEKSND